MAKNEIARLPADELDEILGNDPKTPEEVEKKKRTELDGLAPVEEVKVKDPITNEIRTISIDRTGYGEQKLIVALADPNLTRDRKDYMLSMYLYERGMASASMIADLMRYKGAHTKETRVFKSQMRFDFETLVTLLAGHMRDQARRTADNLGVNLPECIRMYKDWLKSNPSGPKTVHAWFEDMNEENTKKLPFFMGVSLPAESALLSQAIYDYDQAENLERSRDRITKAREAEKGRGIYLDHEGRPYLEDDPDLDDALRRDRELTAEAQNDL